jgi:hypothetical protein
MNLRMTQHRRFLRSTLHGFLTGVVAGAVAVAYWRIRLDDLRLAFHDLVFLSAFGVLGAVFSLVWDLLVRRMANKKPPSRETRAR